MTNDRLTYKMSEEELVVLTAFFLALPLPPVMANNGDAFEVGIEDMLNQTTQKLWEKKLIIKEETGPQSDWVAPGLAQMLRDMAYGNQLIHAYIIQHGVETRQEAYYSNEGRVVHQALYADGVHVFGQGRKDMGRKQFEKLLQLAPKGGQGDKMRLHLEAWNYLLTSRVVGIAVDVSEIVGSMAEKFDGMERETILQFVQDVLTASLVMELTCIYDRVGGKIEKASFVITGNTSWLVIPSVPISDQEMVWALEVQQESLLQALAGVFTALQSNKNSIGRME